MCGVRGTASAALLLLGPFPKLPPWCCPGGETLEMPPSRRSSVDGVMPTAAAKIPGVWAGWIGLVQEV